MNRKFLKISVSIVALLLALAFCMTGCKADDVAKDLENVKTDVSDNKTGAAKALEDAVKALEAKISANEANCAAEIADLAEAMKSVANKADLAKAEKTLNDAVEMLRADLEEAKKALDEKITNNDTKVSEEIARLDKAIKEALAACDAADLASLVALGSRIDECEKTLKAAIEALSADLEELAAYVKNAEKTLADSIADGNKNLTKEVSALQTAVQVAVANSDSADAALKAELEQAIADATKTIVDAVDIIKADLQGKIDALEEKAGTADADVAYLKDALGKLVVEKDENGVIINDVASQLEKLNDALANYKTATEAVVEAWHAIKVTYQLWNECAVSYGKMYIVNEAGDKVDVDLEKEYNSTQVRLYRALSVEEVEEIKNEFFAIIESVKSDAIDSLKIIYNYLLAAEAELGKDTPDLDDVKANLDHAKNGVPYEAGVRPAEYGLVDFEEAKLIVAGDVVDLNAMYNKLIAQYNEYRAGVIMSNLNAANDGINAAETLDDLTDDKALLDAQASAIAELAKDGYDVAELNAKYNEVLNAYGAKYVDIYAASLTERMNAYIDNLGAIYAEVGKEANAIEAIRDDYAAFVDNRDYAEALRREDSAALTALFAAEEKFVTVEEQFAELAELVESGKAVAAILDSEEFAEVTGTYSEFLVIKKYREAAAEWTGKLDAFCESFTANDANNAAKAEILKVIDGERFDTINNAFEASIAELIEAADAVVNAVNALRAEVENGYKLTTAEAIDAAWDAVWTWMGLATDEDGVAFIIEWKSEGAYTHENLVSDVNAIDKEYKAYLANAQQDWADAYVNENVNEITAETLTVYEDRLVAVRAWFNKYGVVTSAYVTEHELGNIGTAEVETQIAALETALATLIENAANEAKALQDRIDNLGTITTDSEDTVKALRADYDAWIEKYGIEVDNSRNAELGLTVNVAELLAAETKLAELAKLVAEIKGLIATLEIPELGEDVAAPYFVNANAKDAYVANVALIAAKLAEFKNANGNDYRGSFTEAELKKVDDAKLVVDKYTALVKVYEAYTTVMADVTDENIIAEMNNYCNKVRTQVDAYDSTTKNASAVILSIGNGALAQFQDIAAGKTV